MVAEAALKEFWYPTEFSSRLDSSTLVPFELFDEPWVLFRSVECTADVTDRQQHPRMFDPTVAQQGVEGPPPSAHLAVHCSCDHRTAKLLTYFRVQPHGQVRSTLGI